MRRRRTGLCSPPTVTEMFDYSYTVAYIAAKETSILDRETLSRVSADRSDAVRYLSQSGYGGDGKTVAEMTDNELSSLRAFVIGALPENLYRLLILPYDAHNLKVMLKCGINGADPAPYLYDNTLIDTEIMAACCRGGEFSLISEKIAAALDPAYDDGTLGTPFGISTEVDRAFSAQIADEASEAPLPVRDFIAAETDGKNLLAYFRAINTGLDPETFSKLILPGGKAPAEIFTRAYETREEDLRQFTLGLDVHDAFAEAADQAKISLSSASDVLDGYVRSKLEPYRYETDSPAPVFLYFRKKTAEARAVREAFQGGVQ